MAWLLENWQPLLLAVQGLLGGIIAVCLFIPGEQPEKALQGILNVIKGISKK